MERKIDDVFKDRKATLKVVEAVGCFGCFYDLCIFDKKAHRGGRCAGHFRSDKKDVIFVKQDK